MFDDVRRRLAGASAVLADEGDAQHIGGARRAQWDTSGDGNAVAGAGKAFLIGDDAGAIDHVFQRNGIFGLHAMDAPDHRHAADGALVGREHDDRLGRPFARRADTGRAGGRVGDDGSQSERFGNLTGRRRDGVSRGGDRKSSVYGQRLSNISLPGC